MQVPERGPLRPVEAIAAHVDEWLDELDALAQRRTATLLNLELMLTRHPDDAQAAAPHQQLSAIVDQLHAVIEQLKAMKQQLAALRESPQ